MQVGYAPTGPVPRGGIRLTKFMDRPRAVAVGMGEGEASPSVRAVESVTERCPNGESTAAQERRAILPPTFMLTSAETRPHVATPRFSPSRAIKRAMDVGLALPLMLIAAPLVLAAAL